MAANSQRIVLLETASSVLRWWSLLVIGGCLGLAGGIVSYSKMAKVYEASTKIFVAPSSIPQQFVRTTVTEDMSVRLRSLNDAVLSRPYLQKLAEQVFGMPDDPERQEQMFAQIRARERTRLIEFDERRGAGLFAISYQDSDPRRAALVANLLADLYIDENVRLRTDQAESTVETLQKLAAEVSAELELQTKLIGDYRAQHVYELADHLNANMNLLSTRQTALEAAERSLAAARERLQVLEGQQATGSTIVTGPAGTTTIQADPYTTRLTQLQRELEALEMRYTDQHPLVKDKQRELDQWLATGKRETEPAATDQAPGTAVASEASNLKLQLEAQRREIARFEAESARIRAEIETYKARIEATPRVEQRLAELSKGYDVLSARYRDYQSKYEEAKGSLKIEESRKGSRFEVVERASPPSFPVRPVLLQVLAIGLGLGLLLALGPFVARGFLSPVVLSEDGLRALDDTPVLVTIDEAETQGVARRLRMRHIVNFAASGGSLAVLVLVAARYLR